MRILLYLLLFWAAWPAVAADPGEDPTRQALRDFRAPMQQLVSEAAKGSATDLKAVADQYAVAKAAWLKVTAEPLDLDRYGVPADQQEEVWRQVRTLGLLMGYLDEAVTRGDRTLILRSAPLLTPAYDKVAAALKVR